MDQMPEEQPVRDAATVVVWRQGDAGPQVLMGQRGAKAAFMPDKFVFPGGAVDAGDGAFGAPVPLDATMARQLAHDAPTGLGQALAHAAIRELWEETGLVLGCDGARPADVPRDWAGFFDTGLVPAVQHLRFFFRAVTPPGRPRRFDARFFLAPATAVAGDIDDFSAACDELRHLQWIDLARARDYPLPFVTEVVLGEVGEILSAGGAAEIPYFHQGVSGSSFQVIPG